MRFVKLEPFDDRANQHVSFVNPAHVTAVVSVGQGEDHVELIKGACKVMTADMNFLVKGTPEEIVVLLENAS